MYSNRACHEDRESASGHRMSMMSWSCSFAHAHPTMQCIPLVIQTTNAEHRHIPTVQQQVLFRIHATAGLIPYTCNSRSYSVYMQQQVLFRIHATACLIPYTCNSMSYSVYMQQHVLFRIHAYCVADPVPEVQPQTRPTLVPSTLTRSSWERLDSCSASSWSVGATLMGLFLYMGHFLLVFMCPNCPHALHRIWQAREKQISIQEELPPAHSPTDQGSDHHTTIMQLVPT